jgi:hypothetical protein
MARLIASARNVLVKKLKASGYEHFTSRVIPVSSKIRLGTEGRFGLGFEGLARWRGRGLTKVCNAVWTLAVPLPSMSLRQQFFPNTSTATSITLHHFDDNPVVSTSTTAHSTSFRSVSSVTARVDSCKCDETVAGCCLLRM